MKHRRLARLARARKLLENRESMELAGRQRRLEAANDRLDRVRDAIRDCEPDVSGEVSARRLTAEAAWRAGLAVEEEERTEVVLGETRRVEDGRVDLLVAHKARRVAENAHEIARRDWIVEQEEAGQKVSDALATSRFARAGGNRR